MLVSVITTSVISTWTHQIQHEKYYVLGWQISSFGVCFAIISFQFTLVVHSAIPRPKLVARLQEYHRVSERYKENVDRRARRVRDVIPDSRLATYGNYEYSEERETMYRQDDNTTSGPLSNFCWTEVTESWMLPDVEKHFAWLTSGGPQIGQFNRELSMNRAPEADVVKMGCVFKTHWDDCLQGQHTMMKKYRWSQESRHESHSSKEINVIDAEEKAENRYQHWRYTIENSMEMQLHVRLTSEAVRSLWKSTNNIQQQFVQQRTRLQQPITNAREQNNHGKERPQQFYYTFQYRPLILRTEYQSARTESYGMTRKHLPPVLSPEVPEFFPKVPVMRFNKEQNANRVQYFPSLNERSYQNELFPYNRAHDNVGNVYQTTGIPLLPATDASTFVRTPQQWYQRIPPSTQIQISSSMSTPMCSSVQPLRSTITHHPLQVQEKFLQPNPIPIPVYQHPIELYHETGQKRKNHGVDFKNLILLTKNAMKAHRGQSKQSHQKPAYIFETRNRSSKTDSDMFQWFDKGGPSKTNEYAAAPAGSLLTELKNDRKSSKNNPRSKSEIGIVIPGSGSKSTNERDPNEIRNRRRLYRDVLTNATVNQAMFDNVFEKRYDELEKQAMEQYRTSEESLALKYQELERQAMEQYGCCENVQGDGGSTDGKQSNEEPTGNIKDTRCFDGRKCSGFGRCSPVNIEENKERDPFTQNQVDLIRTATESESGNSGRSAVLSKSYTTLSKKVSYGSKNTSKGASGDKTNKRVSVRTSSKRRLILVSPFEKESEAKLTRTTDLEEFCCIARGNKNIFSYYNNSKIGQIGGGDENITFIQSPRTEVWLSGFWTT